MDNLTKFQILLLQNLIDETEVLRFGHSEPVADLIDRDLVVEVDGIFVAGKKVTKAKLKKAFEALNSE